MKTALLVIDVQHALFDPEPHPHEAQDIIQRINALTAWARQSNRPVIFIQHEQPGTVLEFDTEGWRLHTDLQARTTDVFIRKTTPDSFLRTNLETSLQQLQVDHLFVCGYASEFCVDTTVRRAAGLGYSVSLVSDAHTTHDKDHATGESIREHHNCTLPHITSFGVTIDTVTTDALIRQN